MKQLLSTLAIGILLTTSASTFADGTSADLVANALNHSDRPSEDAAADARRMPLEVLAFAGLEEGMTILELEAGAGYYTEILSRALGANGNVIVQNPAAFDGFFGEAVENRLANNRLSNVRLSKTNFDELDAADNSIDMVTWILGPHELGFGKILCRDRAGAETWRDFFSGGSYRSGEFRARRWGNLASGARRNCY